MEYRITTSRDIIEQEIMNIMLGWDGGNFTACPYCHADDFTHFEDCPQADNDIIERLVQYCYKLKDRWAQGGKHKNETPHSPIAITDDVLYLAHSLRQGGGHIHR